MGSIALDYHDSPSSDATNAFVAGFVYFGARHYPTTVCGIFYGTLESYYYTDVVLTGSRTEYLRRRGAIAPLLRISFMLHVVMLNKMTSILCIFDPFPDIQEDRKIVDTAELH